MAAIKTYAEQLEEVQAAIIAIESGGVQSYTAFGRSLTRANLKDLYDREKWLRMMTDREGNDNKIRIGYIIR